MKITVLSRPEVEKMEAVKAPHLIISINCPGDEPAKIRTNRATLGRTNLFFWDLDHKPQSGTVEYGGVKIEIDEIPEEHLVQPNDARSIVELVLAHPDAKEIIVHCTAGRSRSAAVAAALHKVLNGDDSIIFNDKKYSPNMRVYRMVLNEWYTRSET